VPVSSSAAPPQNPAQALQSYFGLLPGNTDAGFALLSKGFLSARGQTLQTYTNFWKRYSGVSVANVQQTGPDTVTADVTYVQPNGSHVTDHHRYHMVQENGVWKVDTES
jgi:hypothetical protein